MHVLHFSTNIYICTNISVDLATNIFTQDIMQVLLSDTYSSRTLKVYVLRSAIVF